MLSNTLMWRKTTYTRNVKEYEKSFCASWIPGCQTDVATNVSKKRCQQRANCVKKRSIYII